MRAFVDKETCIGCGLCPDICPEVFHMEDDGLAASKDMELSGDVLESAKEAEEQCPVIAIKVQ
jgi:ferredoxin